MEKQYIHLYNKLKDYSEEDYYPYHMPGHKRQALGGMPEEFLHLDITEIEGFDNLHQPEGILQSLQERAAKLYGAEESFYLINGSTGGILSAISAALPEKGKLLMARNSHKSAYHAAYLRNLTINYLYPSIQTEYDIYDALKPQQIREALEQDADIQAVFLVSPTYEGRIADIQSIADIAHEKGIPLIVDEAHGAHLGWAEGFAQNSCRLGADIVIHSVHKTLPAMTQTSLLHVQGNRIDRERLKRFLHIYQTSSPSYVLMASIDDALRIVEEKGAVLFPAFRQRYLLMMERLTVCKQLQFLMPDGKTQDIGKLVISGKKIGLSGQRIYDILLQRYHLQLEMASGSYCLAMFTIADTEEAYERMEKALLELDQILEREGISGIAGEKEFPSEIPMEQLNALMTADAQADMGQSIPLAIAWDMPWEYASLQESAGQYTADFINLYPPGSPLLVPGEQLGSEKLQCILQYLHQHLNVQGIQETAEGYMLKIIKQDAVNEYNRNGE